MPSSIGSFIGNISRSHLYQIGTARLQRIPSGVGQRTPDGRRCSTMKIAFLGILAISLVYYVRSSTISQNVRKLRVMTINLWYTGRNVSDSVTKFAHFINEYDPDIISFQETGIDLNFTSNITPLLKRNYHHVMNEEQYFSDPMVFSRYEVSPESKLTMWGALGMNISIPGFGNLQFWAVHLNYKYCGTYVLRDRPNAPLRDVLDGEYTTRVEKPTQRAAARYNESIMIIEKVKAQGYTGPLMVVGDYNTPSHMDWVESSKHRHFNRVVEWPVSKILTEQLSLSDAYRVIHPDPSTDPDTWSPVQVVREPKDRIDWILYRQMKAVLAEVVPKPEELEIKEVFGKHRNNSWASDHYAVVADFEL